jgi:hypothetical protein
MAVLSDAVDPATGSGPHAGGGCQARRWGRLVVVLLAGVCFLWGDVGLGEHLERMAGRRQPDRLGKVGAEVVSPSQR